MDIIRRRIRLEGAVQGVGLRWRACHAADAVGATGWVRNEGDGTVLMEIQGNESQIDAVIRAIERGTYVFIESMDARRIPLEEDENCFREKE